jgi:hypothetical protein
VLLAPFERHQALDQDQTADRSRDEQQDQEQAENDFDRSAPSLDFLSRAWTFADFSRSVVAGEIRKACMTYELRRTPLKRSSQNSYSTHLGE